MSKSRYPKCVLCLQSIKKDLTWSELFSFIPLEDRVLCDPCKNSFELWADQRKEIFCQACGRSLLIASQNPYQKSYLFLEDGLNYCYDCYRWRQTYSLQIVRNNSLFNYQKVFKDWIYTYKYLGDCRLAQAMQPFLKKIDRNYLDYQWLVLPSAPESIEKRLFHPTAYLLKTADIPYLCPFIYQGDGKRQAEKSRLDRIALKQPFCLDLNVLSKVKFDQKILLFDDVYTTGATMIRAKMALIDSGFDSGLIESLTLARDNLKGAR